VRSPRLMKLATLNTARWPRIFTGRARCSITATSDRADSNLESQPLLTWSARWIEPASVYRFGRRF
jgi:hypothetical protein